MSPTEPEQELKRAADAIENAHALFITAGAGLGVDSGLPDFRGTEGFWKAYPAIAKLGLSFAEMANPAWFEKSPALAWAFYGHRLNLYRQTLPHAGFDLLLKAAAKKPEGYFVFTSNVDGHFQKAGFAAERIVECHGSIHHFQCTQPCTREIWDADSGPIAIDETTFQAAHPLPRCRRCGELARPNILMFGDGDWLGHRSEAQREKLTDWLAGLIANSARLAIIEIGAGQAIPTVRHTSETTAARTHGTLIRINPREADVFPGQISLPYAAAEGIKKIIPRAN